VASHDAIIADGVSIVADACDDSVRNNPLHVSIWAVPMPALHTMYVVMLNYDPNIPKGEIDTMVASVTIKP
jgi:hypothetical protein